MEQNDYHKRIYFDNGYGLSIISHSFSYGGDEGLFEVALLNSNGDLIYDESLGFGDVLKHLDFQEVADIINKVKKFDKLNHI
jgi:hypothetical protein